MTPLRPQPKAAAIAMRNAFLYQSFLCATSMRLKAPIAPAHAAPCSWPNRPRIAHAVPNARPTVRIPGRNCLFFIEVELLLDPLGVEGSVFDQIGRAHV